jgi:hypothetical protein
MRSVAALAGHPARGRPSAKRRSRRAQWQADYRRRLAQGVRLVEVSRPVVELLIVGQWLDETQADDKAAIADALDALARSTLRNR